MVIPKQKQGQELLGSINFGSEHLGFRKMLGKKMEVQKDYGFEQILG